MKTKKNGGKLILAKSTITNLDAREMGMVHGGVDDLIVAYPPSFSCGCVSVVYTGCPGKTA